MRDGWVWERTEQDAALAAGRFAADGMRLVTVRQPESAGLRETQAALAAALRLPAPAERNLDAFADTLRDLRVWWQGQAVALVWEQSGLLRDTDEWAWRVLVGILDEAQVPTIGARRIVTGGWDDPDVWYYTEDHYESFCEFAP